MSSTLKLVTSHFLRSSTAVQQWALKVLSTECENWYLGNCGLQFHTLQLWGQNNGCLCWHFTSVFQAIKNRLFEKFMFFNFYSFDAKGKLIQSQDRWLVGNLHFFCFSSRLGFNKADHQCRCSNKLWLNNKFLKEGLLMRDRLSLKKSITAFTLAWPVYNSFIIIF